MATGRGGGSPDGALEHPATAGAAAISMSVGGLLPPRDRRGPYAAPSGDPAGRRP